MPRTTILRLSVGGGVGDPAGVYNCDIVREEEGDTDNALCQQTVPSQTY